MCVAVPAKLESCASPGGAGVVDLAGSRIEVSCVLVPEAKPGDWVLVHAGFVIQRLEEAEAREVFGLLKAAEEAGH